SFRMEIASSRRKQSRPERIDGEDEDDVSETSPTHSTSGTPASNHDSHHDDVEHEERVEEDNEEEEVVHVDDDLSDSSPVEVYARGTTLGPIGVRRLSSPLEATRGAIATLVDSSGNALFFEVDSSERVLTAIRPTACFDDANCVVMQDGSDLVRVVITKSVPKTDTLTAVYFAPQYSSEEKAEQSPKRQETPKKFMCEKCGLVSFNSVENLRAHQTTYCSKKDAASPAPVPPVTPRPSGALPAPIAALFGAAAAGTAAIAQQQQPQQFMLPPGLLHPPSLLSTPVMPSPLPVHPPNVIYLPIGYHNHGMTHLTQLLGPPQTIVPIAVPRPLTGGAPLLPHIASSLVINPMMCGAIPIPASLQFMAGDVITNIPIATTTALPDQQHHAASIPALSPHRTPPKAPTPKHSPAKRRPGSPPLDLSSRKRRRTQGNSESPIEAKPSSSSDCDSSAKCSPHRLTPQSPSANAACAPPAPPPRPFPCACGISFSSEATLLAHKTSYCKLTPPKNDENSGSKEPRRAPPRCSHCEFKPTSISQLSVHMRNHHAEAYVCKICGYRGFSVRGIRSHLRTHPELDCVKFDDLLALHVNKSSIVKGRITMEEPPIDLPPSLASLISAVKSEVLEATVDV
ncbi:hypothetical protein PFISCL1PPCAC_20669, partial [Pristionchus fissidentatus]